MFSRPKQSGANEPALVIDRYKKRGEPFVLVLRNFGVIMLQEGKASPRPLLWQSVLESLPAQSGMIMVRNPADGIAATESMFADRSDLPFMALGDDWQEAVRWLIHHAAIIIAEFYGPTPGSKWELDEIIRANAIDRTVVVLPSPGESLPTMDLQPSVEKCLRCVYGHELVERPLLSTFQARDLYDRLVAIASNCKRYKPQSGKPSERLPVVSFEGVREGYFSSADQTFHAATATLKQNQDFVASWRETAELFHKAYWGLRRSAATTLRVGRQRPGSAISDSEAYSIMAAHAHCADMCLRSRMKYTFANVEDQISAAKQHATYALNLAADARSIDSAARELLNSIISRLEQPRPYIWEAAAAPP